MGIVGLPEGGSWSQRFPLSGPEPPWRILWDGVLNSLGNAGPRTLSWAAEQLFYIQETSGAVPEPKLAIPETENQVRCCAVQGPGGRSPDAAALAPPIRTLRGFSWSWGLGARCLCACALLEAELVLVSWNSGGLGPPSFSPLPLPVMESMVAAQAGEGRTPGAPRKVSASLWPVGLVSPSQPWGQAMGKLSPLCAHCPRL